MNSATLVEKYNAKLSGQQLLFRDDDYILLQTPYQSSGDSDFDRKAIAHWWMNVYVPDNNIEQEIYRSWSNAVSSNFKYLMTGGYFPETNQTAITFMANKKKTLESHLKELEYWLPFIKPIKNEKELEHKVMSIMDRTLSEYGSYGLDIYSDSHIEITKIYYYSESIVKTFTSLSNAVSFIQEKLWYKK